MIQANNKEGSSTVVPYKKSEEKKSKQVEKMFDSIAPKYDFLNHFLSLGIDNIWRKKVCKIIKRIPHNKILDMASGTGDLAVAMARLKPQMIKGVDISSNMLEVGRQKIKEKSLEHIITFEQGNAEAIAEEDNSYDVVTCAFGVRNFENMQKGISEIRRILKPKGYFVVLELSMPKNVILRGVYYFYFRGILPIIGRLVSRDNSAYVYLPESVNKFPARERFVKILEAEGFKECEAKSLNFGVSTIFVGRK